MKSMNKIIYSIDVEKDLHTGKYKGIREGLRVFEKICDKHKIKPTLFIVGECIKDNAELFKKLAKKGWEISSHGYSHGRFDEMSKAEKEEEIKKSLNEFSKYLKIKPKGFRAPQHSIDDETLNLLEKYGFKYDSSFTPLNLFQFLFFPKRIRSNLRLFFSWPWKYCVRENLEERPVSSLLIPPVSLIVRILPKWALYLYFKSLMILFKNPIFYAHSWDFIEQKESKIDNLFPHNKFIDKLDFIMGLDK